jgi:hypothetical protein
MYSAEHPTLIARGASGDGVGDRRGPVPKLPAESSASCTLNVSVDDVPAVVAVQTMRMRSDGFHPATPVTFRSVGLPKTKLTVLGVATVTLPIPNSLYSDPISERATGVVIFSDQDVGMDRTRPASGTITPLPVRA